MAHTKGPWEVSKHGVPEGIYQSGIYAGSESKDLAIVRTSEDDANLIAAAPELLEALERLLEAMYSDKEISPNMPVIISWETNGDAIRQARSAIAKVKGS